MPYTAMPGRHTGNARHLTDPKGKNATTAPWKKAFMRLDVATLAPTLLYEDGNVKD